MNNRKLNIKWPLIFVTILVSACTLFIEEDISDNQITTIAPGNNVITDIATQTFWWKINNDVTGYRLQIVSPNFDATESVLLDSLITKDKYEFTLYPDTFEWRIRGENGVYQTDWTVSGLIIVPTDNLTKQKVRLRSPDDNIFTKDESVTFKWDTIPNVDTYQLILYTGAWGETKIEDSMDIKNPSLTLKLTEGEMWWGIKAFNFKSESLFAHRRLIVDRTEPIKPSDLKPDETPPQSNTEVEFSWSSSDPTWEIVKDSLLIYEKVSTDSEELFKALLVTNKTAKVELDSGKEYSWKVISIDQAGNKKESDSKKLVIN